MSIVSLTSLYCSLNPGDDGAGVLFFQAQGDDRSQLKGLAYH